MGSSGINRVHGAMEQGCLQWHAMVISLSYILIYHGLLVMQEILAKSPFDPEGECVNIDYLLSGTEAMLYDMLRAGLSQDEPLGSIKSHKSSVFSAPIKRRDLMHTET